MHTRAAATVLFIALGVSACHGRRHGVVNARGGGPQSLSEADIAAVAAAIRTSEIEQAQVAQDRGHDQRVRVFADQTVDRQSVAGQRDNATLDRVGIEPRENSMSRAIERESGDTVAAISEQQGAAFDRAYIQAQIRMQERALSVIDRSLIPNAERPELRAQLQSQRRVINDRLALSRTIDQGLPEAGALDRGIQVPLRGRP